MMINRVQFYINVGVDDNNMRWCIVTNEIKKNNTRLCVSKVIYFFGQLTIWQIINSVEYLKKDGTVYLYNCED